MSLTNPDPRVTQYIDDSEAFAQPILNHLREQIHLHCPAVVESIKWANPHFTWDGTVLPGE